MSCKTRDPMHPGRREIGDINAGGTEEFIAIGEEHSVQNSVSEQRLPSTAYKHERAVNGRERKAGEIEYDRRYGSLLFVWPEKAVTI